MPKFETESMTEVRSAFFERRRLRRIRMIVELTMNLVGSDMTVTYREACCLIDCARKAILELHPSFEDRFERVVRPHFECLLAERWPQAELLRPSASELVN
jgi:hypothetical protein